MPHTIYLGADHAGFELKEKIKQFLQSQKLHVKDCGAKTINPDDDYPDFAAKVAAAVSKDAHAKGILICGSAQGMCIVANKFPGIRAVVVTNSKDAKLTRLHNDANVVCLSGWNMPAKRAEIMITIWLTTLFEGGRHMRRLKKIERIEALRHCEQP